MRGVPLTAAGIASRAGIVIALAGCCEEGLTKPQELAIDPPGPLRAIARGSGGYRYDYYLVDDAGYVSIFSPVKRKKHYELELVDQVSVSQAPLIDVTAEHESVWIVDEAGGVFESSDAGRTWVSRPLDPGLVPRGILLRWSGCCSPFIVVYGDDFVRWSVQGSEWVEPADVPEGGWGSMRFDASAGDWMLLSDGEDLLIVNDPRWYWQRIDAPTDVLALGYHEGATIIGGRDGILMQAIVGETDSWIDATWTPIDEDIDANVVAIDRRWVLTDKGEIIDLESDEVLDVGAARAGFAAAGEELVVFGTDGPVLTTKWITCDSY